MNRRDIEDYMSTNFNEFNYEEQYIRLLFIWLGVVPSIVLKILDIFQLLDLNATMTL